jgi:plastocyanin
MNRKVILGLGALLIIVAGAIAMSNNNSKESGSTATSANQNTAETTSPAETSTAGVITYGDNGFTPTTLTVKPGDKVTIKNTTSGTLQFQSDPHPQHTDDPELNIGSIASGESQTFTVTTMGSHGYHNHLSTSDTGTIVVN